MESSSRVPVVALFENLEDGVPINQIIELFRSVKLIHARKILEHAAKSAMAVREPSTEINWFEVFVTIDTNLECYC